MSEKMNLSKHAKKRVNQRGFSNSTLNIILKYGSVKRAPGGARSVFFGKKEYQKIVSELKKTIQLMERAKNGKLIIIDDHIITAYK